MNTSVPPKPHIVGIINLTEDSFSDGGRFLEPHQAMIHAQKLIEAGADSVDLGPAASNPKAKLVSFSEEIKRLTPVMKVLRDQSIPFSVDSFHPETQELAIEAGATYLNDIQGFPHKNFYPVLAKSNCRLVVMHSVQRSGIATMQPPPMEPLLHTIKDFFEHRIEALTRGGIDRDRLVLDPGMGFFLGNTDEPSLEVLKNIQTLKTLFQLPIYISVSRKSFLNRLAGSTPQTCGAPTLAAELFAATQGVDFIRTHDPKALTQALRVWEKLR